MIAPRSLAAQAGLAALRDGGNAIEAAVATAAALAVAYPHMTGIGGDAFQLIKTPGNDSVSFDGQSRLAGYLTACSYHEQEYNVIPTREPLAANSVAGAVSAWDKVLEYSKQKWHGHLPLSHILGDAVIDYAKNGYPVTESKPEPPQSESPRDMRRLQLLRE